MRLLQRHAHAAQKAQESAFALITVLIIWTVEFARWQAAGQVSTQECHCTSGKEEDAAAALFGSIYVLNPVSEGHVFAERRLRMLEMLSFLSHKLPVKVMGIHHSEHDVLLAELNMSATHKDGRKRKPAWGRLANLAGARRIWAACAAGTAHTCLVLEDDVQFQVS